MDYKRIKSLQHPIIKHAVKLKNNRDYRYEHQCVLIEGYKTISELSSKITFLRCFLEEGKTFPFVPSAKEYFLITAEISKKISGVVTPEGIIVESPLPPYKDLSKSKKILALDGVSDPGNFGTILRTAIAFGWNDVLLLPSCVDPFNDKVIRSSKGGSFLINLMEMEYSSLEHFAHLNLYKVIYADMSGKKPEEMKLEDKIILVLGNESSGVSAKIKAIGNSVSLPMVSMESLNVAIAGSILMYLWKDYK